MKLVVGLGNPGEKYKSTRHNVGYMVVDSLRNDLSGEGWEVSKKGKLLYSWAKLGGEKIELVKPQTFMNDSGFSVAYGRNKHKELKISDIYVIHDDLDIKLGEYKIQQGKGPREHNGVLSIEEKLGNKEFWRVRVGVENRHSEIAENISRGPVRGAERSLSGKDYVLQSFLAEEQTIIADVIEKVIVEIKLNVLN